VIHWQRVDGDVVTTFKTYYGTHRGNFLGICGTGTKVSFETVDAMRVVNGKITEHWAWQTSTLSCSSWARSVHCRRLEKVRVVSASIAQAPLPRAA
jgi:hypothetical protein